MAYFLLPDHFHFFIKVRDINNGNVNELLEQQFKKLFSSYVLSFNIENKRNGSLFQKSFKRIKVEEQHYFTAIIRYIHNNPIHHRLVLRYEDWKYSSYNAIVSNKPTIIQAKEVLEWFGGIKMFKEFHQANIVYDKNAFFD